MEINLWFFLSVTIIFGTALIIVAIINGHKTKIIQLEIEALTIKKANIKAEVEEAVNLKLAGQLQRIEVLEKIITDKNYELNEKITKLV